MFNYNIPNKLNEGIFLPESSNFQAYTEYIDSDGYKEFNYNNMTLYKENKTSIDLYNLINLKKDEKYLTIFKNYNITKIDKQYWITDFKTMKKYSDDLSAPTVKPLRFREWI